LSPRTPIIVAGILTLDAVDLINCLWVPLVRSTALIDIRLIKPNEITIKPLATGLRYWSSLRYANGSLPSRQDFDPVEVPSVLPYVELTEVIDGGRDFRFRLIGSHLVDVDDINPTGQLLSSFFKVAAYKEYQFSLYKHVIARGVPLYS
jgi:hypothetical protein